MTAPTRQHIFIYDHPESKIKFLETTLREQDWMASIVVPPAQTPDPQSYVNHLEEELKPHFVTSQSKEADGTISLHLHHLGNHTTLPDALEEMGLVKGTKFTLDHVGTHLSKLISGTSRYLFEMVKEPGRLFSAIYLLGDISYSASGAFAGKAATGMPEEIHANYLAKKKADFGSFMKPENFLSSLTGWLATAQSLIVIHYANNGGELNYSDLKNQFHQGERAGIDAMNVKGWTAPDMNKRLLGPFDDLARQHPLEVGASAQILGQVALLGSSGFKIAKSWDALKATPKSDWLKTLTQANPVNFRDITKHNVNENGVLRKLTYAEAESSSHYAEFLKHDHAQLGISSIINVMRSLISITAWTVLMHPAKEGKVTADWLHPLDRLKQEYDYHPERMAGAVNVGASLTGMTASHFQGNHAALGAEIIWLLGDVAMMFVHKEKYGGKAATKEVPLIDAATKLLQELPVAVSESHQRGMVSDLALHLAQKTIDEKIDSSAARTAPVNEEVAELKKSIETGVNANLSMINTYYSRVMSACSILVERFEPSQREGIILALTHGIAAAPGVYATETEIADTIRSRVHLTAGYGLEKPSMGSLARDIAQIVTAAPPIAKAGIGTAVYDAVMPLMHQGPHDTLLLAKAVEQVSREHELASHEQTHVSKLANTPSVTSLAKA